MGNRILSTFYRKSTFTSLLCIEPVYNKFLCGYNIMIHGLVCFLFILNIYDIEFQALTC